MYPTIVVKCFLTYVCETEHKNLLTLIKIASKYTRETYGLFMSIQVQYFMVINTVSLTY